MFIPYLWINIPLSSTNLRTTSDVEFCTELNVLRMKSGITFAVLLGLVACIAGAVLKTMHFSSANGLLLGGAFLAVLASVFWVLHQTPKQPE